jgi:hypothetical protein
MIQVNNGIRATWNFRRKTVLWDLPAATFAVDFKTGTASSILTSAEGTG